MKRGTTAGRGGGGAGWGWFLSWLALGGCVAAGLAAVLTVGPVLVLLAAVAAGLLLRKGPRNAIAGLPAGLAVPLLYIAYLNRGGPGNVCRTTADAQTCTDEYTPVPFLAGGVALFLAGFLLFAVLARRNARTGRPGPPRPPGRPSPPGSAPSGGHPGRAAAHPRQGR